MVSIQFHILWPFIEKYGDRRSIPWISLAYSSLPHKEVSIGRWEYLYLYIFLEAEGGKKLLKHINRVFFLYELENLYIKSKGLLVFEEEL